MNFSSTTFTTIFKICLYARCFDSSVCPHNNFWWHFVDSPKLLKNHLITANLNEVKSSSLTKWFFKSLEESAKCDQKILCSHTDESKHLVYRHILKNSWESSGGEIQIFVFFQFTCDPPRWSPLLSFCTGLLTFESFVWKFLPVLPYWILDHIMFPVSDIC